MSLLEASTFSSLSLSLSGSYIMYCVLRLCGCVLDLGLTAFGQYLLS